MDLLSVSHLLLLLFPLKNSRQVQYANLTKQSFFKSAAENFFAEDSFPWEEKNSAEEFSEEEFQKIKAENFYLKNSLGKIKSFEFGEEKLSLTQEQNGETCAVTINDDIFSKTVFDSEFRSVEKITWKNGKTLDEAKILSRKKWNYNEENFFVEEENFSSEKIFETLYDKNKNPVLILEFKSGGEGEKKLLKKSLLEYDEENRLTSDEEFFYDADSKSKKPAYTKKNIFTYTEKSSEPDSAFFENGKPRFTINYTDEDSYEKTLFFEEGFSVRLKYENGTLTQEEIFAANDGEKF